MTLWEIFVLGQVGCMNTSYDQLHYMANYDQLLRGIMGVVPSDFSLGRQYEYQNIYDNVGLLDDALLKEVNNVIVEVGYRVFKKKGSAVLRLKTDSFVVETDTHFPTDYNLLWDSAHKCIDGNKPG
jgi:transposase, IS5 family